MEQDLVSVIMPTFNEVQYLSESIECILGQSYSHLELLITDDCSANTEIRDCLRYYAQLDNRVRIFFLDENKGPGYARNNSIREAKGRFIAFCDSDDRWTSDKLEKQVAFMKKHNVCLSYTSYYLYNSKGKVYGIAKAPKRMTFKKLKRDNKIGCSTAMYDTAICGKMYMPTLRKRQDWGLFLLILKNFGVAYGIKEPLAYYRKHRDSISTQKYTLVKYNIKVYQKVLGYTKAKSALYMWLVFMPTYFFKRLRMWVQNLFYIIGAR